MLLSNYCKTVVWILFVLTFVTSCSENSSFESSETSKSSDTSIASDTSESPDASETPDTSKTPDTSESPEAPLEKASCGAVDESQSETRRCYHSSTVPFGSECTFDEQTRTCIDGEWKPNWPLCESLACEVASSVGVERYRKSSLTRITENGGRLDWSPSGEWLVFDRHLAVDDYYDVYRMRPDGTEQSCLTCDHPDLPNRHQGQPAYHPSGDYIVFQAEMTDHPGPSTVANPGAGGYCDLWLLESSPGGRAYQLTFENNSFPAGGVLHPHFSHDGKHLLWGRREGAGGSFGDWEVVVADFEITNPSLLNEARYNPGERTLWYETQDWSRDDGAIYFAASLQKNQHDFAMDIYRMSLKEPDQITRLTHSSGKDQEDAQWEEHAKLSPQGDVIAYMSSEPYGLELNKLDRSKWLKTDLWLMNTDGSEATRYTFFNEPGYDEYDPTLTRVAVADMSWNPDGSQIAFLAIKSFGTSSKQREEIWVLSFSPFTDD